MSVENKTTNPITIAKPVNEELAIVEEESAVVGTPEQMKKQHGIYVETNYALTMPCVMISAIKPRIGWQTAFILRR
jgi:hypothetical protein